MILHLGHTQRGCALLMSQSGCSVLGGLLGSLLLSHGCLLGSSLGGICQLPLLHLPRTWAIWHELHLQVVTWGKDSFSYASAVMLLLLPVEHVCAKQTAAGLLCSPAQMLRHWKAPCL